MAWCYLLAEINIPYEQCSVWGFLLAEEGHNIGHIRHIGAAANVGDREFHGPPFLTDGVVCARASA